MTMRNWILWTFFRKEMAELYRWQVRWHEYRRWLAMFPEIAIAMDAMKADVEQRNVEFVAKVRERIIAARAQTNGPLPSRSEDLYQADQARHQADADMSRGESNG